MEARKLNGGISKKLIPSFLPQMLSKHTLGYQSHKGTHKTIEYEVQQTEGTHKGKIRWIHAVYESASRITTSMIKAPQLITSNKKKLKENSTLLPPLLNFPLKGCPKHPKWTLSPLICTSWFIIPFIESIPQNKENSDAKKGQNTQKKSNSNTPKKVKFKHQLNKPFIFKVSISKFNLFNEKTWRILIIFKPNTQLRDQTSTTLSCEQLHDSIYYSQKMLIQSNKSESKYKNRNTQKKLQLFYLNLIMMDRVGISNYCNMIYEYKN